MSEAKETILGRIKKALHNVPETEQPEDVPVSRTYRRQGDHSRDEAVSLFVDRVGEYKATVKRIDQRSPDEAVAEACSRQAVRQLVVPDGFPKNWLPTFIEPLYDIPDSPLTNQQLDASDGVITTCGLAVAQTGTIILDTGPGQGRRALTLVPDYHLCIVWEDQIVELFPEAIARLKEKVVKNGLPITFISGPSATSDIELSRVEGVHGPRRLEVLIMA